MNWIKSVWAGFTLCGIKEAWRGYVSMAKKHLFLKKAEHFLTSCGNYYHPLKKSSVPCSSSVVDCQVRKTDPVLWNLQGRTGLPEATACLCYSVHILQVVVAYGPCTIREEK
jgi:hypothetical protein